MIYLLALFGLLNAADAWTTWQVLRFGGRETNPAINWLTSRIGLYRALVAFKAGVIVLVWINADKIGFNLLAALDCIYAVIVYHNWTVLKTQKTK